MTTQVLVQIARTIQNAPNLNSIRKRPIENRVTSKVLNAPRADLRKAQIQPLTANAWIGGEKFECLVSSFKKRICRGGIILINVRGRGLQIAKDESALLPARIHFSFDRIFEMFERSPGVKGPRAASASFSRIPGGVSSVGSGRSQSGCNRASNSSRSCCESRSMAAMISATVLTP